VDPDTRNYRGKPQAQSQTKGLRHGDGNQQPAAQLLRILRAS